MHGPAWRKMLYQLRETMLLDGIEIATSILIVHVPFLDFLGKLTLPLPRFLGTLQLQAVLVHGEPHSLRTQSVSGNMPFSEI